VRPGESPAWTKHEDAEPYPTDSKRHLVHQWTPTLNVREEWFWLGPFNPEEFDAKKASKEMNEEVK
jgi:hypothetical protein